MFDTFRFVLYRGIYIHSWSPGLPGEGPFKYVTFKAKLNCQHRRSAAAASGQQSSGGGAMGPIGWSSKDDVPKFMGMPLYGYKKEESSKSGGGGEDEQQVARRPQRPRSRSSSMNRFSSSKNSLNAKFH
jgi:hypothetical protein